MQNYHLQHGLLLWLGQQPSRTVAFSRIRQICYRLFITIDTVGEEKSIVTKQAVSSIFYPLFKCGAIEFYGNGQYGLSPTTCLYNRDFMLCCNFPDEIVVAPEQNVLYARPGMYVTKYSAETINKLNLNNVSAEHFNLVDTLRQVPSIKKIVSSWADDANETHKYKYKYQNNQWIKCNGDTQDGIYSESEKFYVTRYLKFGNTFCKQIPSPTMNPDAIHLAQLFLSHDYHRRIRYNATISELEIISSSFPNILERLLFLQTLLRVPAGFDEDSRIYKIDNREFTLLHRIIFQD